MKMRYAGILLSILSISACAPSVPNSVPESGVGFGEYVDYGVRTTAREAELTGNASIVNGPQHFR